jgi:hypothetical protein
MKSCLKRKNFIVVGVLTALLGFFAEARGAEPNLVGWWEFDDGLGAIAYDSIGSNNGTLNNMDDADWVEGYIGYGALEFDGFNDYVSVPALNLNSYTVTITAWIKRDGVQAETYTGIVFSRDGSTVAGLNFGMGPGGWDDINHELAYTWNGRKATWSWRSELFIPDNEWVFVALVVEPTQATLYLGQDGVLSSATNVLDHDIEQFDGVTRIGHDVHTATRYFKGTVDDVRIYNCALDISEINIIFGGKKAFKPNPSDGATNVQRNAVLSWSPGTSTVWHDVYFGDDFNDVNDATYSIPLDVYKGRQSSASYIPTLAGDTTHYWRIDEVDANNTIYKGEVWSFKTIPAGMQV